MTAPACTCGASTSLHDVECMTAAVTQRNAMVNSAGEVFYPDDPEDAAWFAIEHGAQPLHPEGLPW